MGYTAAVHRSGCSILLLAALLAILLCACGNKSEPGQARAHDCAAVGEQLVALGHASAEHLQGRQENVFETQIQLVKDEVVATCQRDKWPAEARACMVAAADRAAFDACAAGLPAVLPAPARTVKE